MKDTEINKRDDFYSTADEDVFKDIKYFSENESFINIYKKTEKISSALVLISNIIKDNISFTNKLQALSLTLMEYALSLATRSAVQRVDIMTQLINVYTQTHALLTLGANGRSISPMNASIVKREIEYCLNLLSHNMPDNSVIDDAVISRSFFQISRPSRPNSLKPKEHSDKGQREYKPRTIENTPQDRDRKSVIIEHLKIKDNQNIKDFATIITDCSEKTIQRDLIELIGSGLIMRKGKRRWSTYSLVSRI